MRRRVARLLVVVSFALCGPLSAENLPELFQKAKAQVKSQSWQEALTTLDQLDAESARPGNEAARQQLVAPIAFYRGVCEANLDQRAKAEADFAAFRQAEPDAAIDKAVYSKKAVAAFDAVGRDAARQPAASDSLARRFEEFTLPPNSGEKPDAHWADGPIKWIITPEESAAWSALTSDAARAEFVERFWQARNPKPSPADNPTRTELERRIAFADAYLQQNDKQRGSMTDPGMVFVLLGPPSRTTRRPLITDEDQNLSEGMELPELSWMGSRNSIHIFGPHQTDATDNSRDIWHYRRETLPKGPSTYELYVSFVTKRGYGRSVLQRDPAVLSVLNAARAEAAKSRSGEGATAASRIPR